MRYSPTLAVNRFGLGAHPGDIEAVNGDPVGWLKGQLEDPVSSGPAGPSTTEAVAQFAEWQKLKKAAKSGGAALSLDDKNPARTIWREEASNWLAHAVKTDRPFLERLTLFWQNHFCVSAEKPAVAVLAGAYVREAIRPNIGRRFADMLKACAQHPAMLTFLDNRASIGPNSKAGQRQSKGLNENLAREILELHTLGTGGGYTPSAVTSFAKLITGWSFGANPDEPDIGVFKFRAQAHEPGALKILDLDWPGTGLAEGEAFLEHLATHPATARHIAAKLARHFVADDPPAPLVEAVEAAFLKTSGELAACYQALLAHEAAWLPDPGKFRTPQSFLVAALRGLAIEPAPNQAFQPLTVMGQPLWRAPSPKGWPDTASAWMTSDAMKTRLDFAASLAAKARAPEAGDPRVLAKSILGDRLTDETATTLARAADNKQALTLLLMSPEFQRC